HGKGIILMHDFQQATAKAAPELLQKLKDGGDKVVQVVGKTPTQPKKEYTDMVLKEMGGGLEEARPMSSVIKTIGGNYRAGRKDKAGPAGRRGRAFSCTA